MANPFQITEEEPPPPNTGFIVGKWYWFDETGEIEGPYDTKSEAQERLDKYIKWLETGERNESE